MAKSDNNEQLVSVIIPTFNRAHTIEACIISLLRQSYQNFELIICDDASTDSTTEIIERYQDRRIVLIRRSKNSGPAATRNEAVNAARGEFIFFTDDDVVTPPDWLATGMSYFDDDFTLGVEGKIVYVSKDYVPCYSERIVQNSTGGLYMTANIAYRKSALLSVGLFDEELRQYEDRVLGFRVRETGKVVFAKNFVVTHQRETYSIRSFFGEATKVQYRILCLVKINDRAHLRGPFYEPLKFVVMFFPFLLLARLRTHKFESGLDWGLLCLAYPRFFFERILIWSYAIKSHRFII